MRAQRPSEAPRSSRPALTRGRWAASALPEAQFILDKSNAIYRITSYKTHVCIELSAAALCAINADDRPARVASDFNRLTGANIESQSVVYLREFKNARVNLSLNNYAFHQELHRANTNLGIELTGSAAGFGLGSIADQMIQGLRLAAYRNSRTLTEFRLTAALG